MKKIVLIGLLIFFAAFYMGCNSESRDNSRAYVEGTVTGNKLDYKEIKVTLKSEGTIIAEATPNSSGGFVISGPLLSETFSLVSNRKIKSFAASKSGCILSSDALQISIPPGTTYITFNEIILE